MMDQHDLENALEHAAASLLMAAERDQDRAEEMRDLAAQIQAMMSKLDRGQSLVTPVVQ